MPLISGKSQNSFKKNVETEMDAGKPMKQSLAIAYSMKRKAKKMADGGEVQAPTIGGIINYPGAPKTAPVRKAYGGEIGDQGIHDEEYESGYLDMPDEDEGKMSAYGYGGDVVDKVMRKRMSRGGMVANDTEIEAGFKPNQFDDLVLRDDLSSDYGASDNSGDELGNAQEDEDRRDVVSKIMRQRALRDRMPRPA